MRKSALVLLGLCAVLVLNSSSGGMTQLPKGKGKFYIVGMGTVPDLITVRGVEVIKGADIVLVGNDEDRKLWSQYIANKEVWYCPNSIRSMYGVAPKEVADPQRRAIAERGAEMRGELVSKIKAAVDAGKIVASLQSGDPMMYGLTLLLESLPKDIPTEIVPGIGAFQAASAAVQMSPPYGYDTNGVILTAADWQGRLDENEKLMAPGSSMVFYTMQLDYQKLFAQLQNHYSGKTPVAIVVNAGDRTNQQVIRSTVAQFLNDVDYKKLPMERSILLVGKFLEVGQARKDFLPQIERGFNK